MREYGICSLLVTVLLTPRLFCQWIQLPGPEGGSVSAFLASGGNTFAASYSGDIYVSRDGGTTWAMSYSGDSPRHSCLAQMGSALFAGGWGGIIRSTDGGRSWAESDSGFPQAPSILSLLSYDTLLYATTAPPLGLLSGGIYVSADTGRHWTHLFTPIGSLNRKQMYAVARKGNVLCAGSDYMYRSTDCGVTWDSLMNGAWFCTSIVADSSRFYAATSWGGLFYSMDNGESWTHAYTFPDSNQYSSSDFYRLAIQKGVLYAVGTPGMARSTDQGVTWTELGEVKRHHANGFLGYNRFTAVYGASEHLYLSAEWGGIYRSTDNGDSWTESNRGFHDLDVASIAVENQSVYAVAQGVGFFRSDDNGDSWMSSVVSGKNLYFTSIAARGQNVFIGTSAGVYRSVDRGSTWTLSDDLGWIGGLYLLNDKLYARGNGVFVSSDSAQTWTPINNGLTNLSTLSFGGSGSKLYVGTMYGGVHFSTDGGASWAPIDRGYIAVVYAEGLAMMKEEIFVHTANYASGEPPRLLHSADDGATWLGADYGLSLSKNDAIRELLVKDSLVFVTTDHGLALSTSKGASWEYCSTRPLSPTLFTRGPLASNAQYLFIGGDGKSIVRAPLSNLLTGLQAKSEITVPTNVLLMQNYPNPFNPSTTLRYGLPEAARVSLIVYNTLAQQVADLVEGERTAGYHEVRWEAAGLASGIYFARLTVTGALGRILSTQTVKLVLMK